MSVTIRFQRHGRTHKPFYHMVATDSRNSRNGRFLEKLGYYDPSSTPSTVVFKEDRLKHWYGRGATLSHAVKTLMRKHKVNLTRDTAKKS